MMVQLKSNNDDEEGGEDAENDNADGQDQDQEVNSK